MMYGRSAMRMAVSVCAVMPLPMDAISRSRTMFSNASSVSESEPSDLVTASISLASSS